MSANEIINLCEVDILCIETGTRTFRLRLRDRTSRPICTCEGHIEAARALALSEGVEFIDCGPIAGPQVAQ